MKASVTKKFAPPGLPSTILHRLPLINLLQNALINTSSSNTAKIHKLVLLCTPAGYGKTTLLSDFSEQTGFPCCWYILDDSDIDTGQFINHFVATIGTRFPQFAEGTAEPIEKCISDELQPGRDQQFTQLVDFLVTAIHHYIPERFAIFLCNYHEVNDNALINSFIDKLLLRLPEQCTIAIESRAIPSLQLASLLSRRQLLGIGSNLLYFTDQDIQELMHLQHITPISEEEVANIARSFNGWIAGILLGTRLGDTQILPQQPYSDRGWGSPAIRTDKQNLLDYLTNEVFKHEATMYTFLKDASLLKYMTPSLCDAILEISNAESRLTYMEQKGLFVTRGEDRRKAISYTFHPLLRVLLYEEASRENHSRVQALHRRAADLFFLLKDYDQAMYHALAIHEYTLAVHFIKNASTELSLNQYAETIAGWIDLLPTEILEEAPDLLLTRANIHLNQSEWTLAQDILEKAHDLMVNRPVQENREAAQSLLAAILIAQSRTKFNVGEYHKAQELCQKALELLPEEETELRARAHHYLGQAAALLGDCLTGLVQMQQALRLWGHNTKIRETAILHGNLANVYSMLGNYTLAEHHRKQAIATFEQLGDIRGKINNLIGMAITVRNKGALEEASKLLQEAFMMAHEADFMSGEAYALENLGEVYQDQSLLEQSLKALEDCLALASQLKDKMLSNNALCALAMTYFLMGDPQTATFLVNQTESETKNTASYEKMLCELTRGTIYLYQHQFQEAYPHLNSIPDSLQKAGLKSHYIRALIRLAACQIGMKQESAAIHSMELVVEAIKQSQHEHIATIEFIRLPELLQAIQIMPAAARLATWSTQTQTEPDTVSKPQTELISTNGKSKTLHILALGNPDILIDNVLVSHWRMARSRELYFYLLDIEGFVRKEQIIDVLWSEAGENIDQTFRSTIYHLRRIIGESCVVYHSGKYMLNHTPLYGQQVYYDIKVFRQQYAIARQLIQQGDEMAAAKNFQEMVNLYRGDYVQAFYSNWCISRRDELRRMYMDARQRLATIAWNNEQLDESLLHWQQLLAMDDCFEEAHYGIMRCYLRQGKRNLAFRQYQQCVDVLRENLSISPGPAIQKLYQRLTDQSG